MSFSRSFYVPPQRSVVGKFLHDQLSIIRTQRTVAGEQTTTPKSNTQVLTELQALLADSDNVLPNCGEARSLVILFHKHAYPESFETYKQHIQDIITIKHIINVRKKEMESPNFIKEYWQEREEKAIAELVAKLADLKLRYPSIVESIKPDVAANASLLYDVTDAIVSIAKRSTGSTEDEDFNKLLAEITTHFHTFTLTRDQESGFSVEALYKLWRFTVKEYCHYRVCGLPG
jgi:hypothetical protein